MLNQNKRTMFNYPKEQSFEQGLKDSINKLTNQLPRVSEEAKKSKDDYHLRQLHARIQVFKRALQLLNDIPERTS